MDDLTKLLVEKIDIVEVISERIDVVKKGNNFLAVCPFHDDHSPSLSISPTKKIYRCFSCQNGGDVIKFVMDYDKISFREAQAKLAAKIGMTIEVANVNPKEKLYYDAMDEAARFYHFYLKNTVEGEIALQYLKKRGIDETLVDYFKIGLAPTEKQFLHQSLNQAQVDLLIQRELGLVKEDRRGINDMFCARIMFPITNKLGQVIAFSGRTYLENDQSTKYINSIEHLIFKKSRTLYNFSQATKTIRQKNRVYILEGFMDVIACHKAGVGNGVATMGTALTKEHITLLNSFTKNIVLCFDGDLAGINATKKALNLFSQTGITPQVVTLPDGLDPDEYAQKYGDIALKNVLEQKSTSIYDYLFAHYKNKTDFTNPLSIEEFRLEIIQMLKVTNNQTYINFYLEQLGKLIKQSPEELKRSLSVSPVYQVETKKETEVISTAEPVGKVKVSKAVLLALDNIIYHSVMHLDSFIIYLRNFENEYYDCQLSAYSSILYKIKELYESNDSKHNLEFSHLTSFFNAGSEAEYIINRLQQSKYIDVDNQQEFYECLNTLSAFVEKEKNKIKLLKAQESDENIEDYLEHRRKSIKLK